jgi:NAD(P)-dependent dehydrogenase (short-subunit alcohol dehydrogenase family)
MSTEGRVSQPVLERLFSLRGRTALVTGASGGIGGVLAAALADAGAMVGLHGQRQPQLEAMQRAIAERGGEAHVFPADLSDARMCRALIASVQERLGRLDILVNCAGINRRNRVERVSEADFDAIIDINLRSVFLLCQSAYPGMRDQGGGKIVNIGSITSSIGLGSVGPYGATKAALANLTRTMAVEWARDNIQVNCLAPGFIHTPLTAEAVWGDPWRRQWLLDRIPARRPGVSEDLVGAMLLLASPASDYITGQLLTVDGGFLAGGSWLRDDE